jgi:hypothetical protein
VAVDENFWTGLYIEDRFPPWPCPRCGRHSISIQDGSFAASETPESRAASKHPDWEPEWDREQFVGLLACKEKNCGHVASVAGITKYKSDEDGEGSPVVDRYLEPHFVEPAPNMLKIPKETPKEVTAELEAAFSLFWHDPGAALNSIRTSIEMFLDSKGVQRKAKRKRGGGLRPLSLHERIERFLPSDSPVRAKMIAVKWLGNVGSHETSVRKGTVVDALELVDYILEELVEGRQKRLDRKARDINKRKGKPKKPKRPPF